MSLTSEQVADYERAAVALETHADLPTPYADVTLEQWAFLAWGAWTVIAKQWRGGKSRSPEDIDDMAARLIRKAINSG